MSCSPPSRSMCFLAVFFFNDTATTEIYTLSLHDALPIYGHRAGPSGAARGDRRGRAHDFRRRQGERLALRGAGGRSEEHTSELQSRLHLVCRLLLEKKKHIGRCYAPTAYEVSAYQPIAQS